MPSVPNEDWERCKVLTAQMTYALHQMRMWQLMRYSAHELCKEMQSNDSRDEKVLKTLTDMYHFAGNMIHKIDEWVSAQEPTLKTLTAGLVEGEHDVEESVWSAHRARDD